MRVATLDRREVTDRLDAPFFVSEGQRAVRALRGLREAPGWTTLPLADMHAEVVLPARFKRRYASAHVGVPYLRPYDIFQFLPAAADFLADGPHLAPYRVAPLTILQTRSGRNLGPAVMVDAYLSGFIMSDDLIQVRLGSADASFYVAGFLNTPVGQELLRRDMTGSVIDHLDASQVARLPVPQPPERLRSLIAAKMREAFEMRESARLTIVHEQALFEAAVAKQVSLRTPATTWSITRSGLRDRHDAAPYEPSVAALHAALLRSGGCALTDVADVAKPTGRYKTSYVAPEYGTPILSGTQVHQIRPIAPKFIRRSALGDAGRYEVRTGSILYQADGRAEEGLGVPSMVPPSRDGWLASGHVGRLTPRSSVDVGGLFIAFRSEFVQRQVRAQASGSVVDATFPDDMSHVAVPPLPAIPEVWEAWCAMDRATAIEDEAVALLQSEFDAAR